MDLLVIGYGNVGRGDDGLGPALAGRLARTERKDCSVEVDYQLTVEHALQVADAKTVLFVDASIEGDAPFTFTPAQPDRTADIASHSLEPGAVLALAEMLYGKTPEAFILGIKGESFGEVAEGLSDTASTNLDLAESYVLEWLASGAKHGSRTC